MKFIKYKSTYWFLLIVCLLAWLQGRFGIFSSTSNKEESAKFFVNDSIVNENKKFFDEWSFGEKQVLKYQLKQDSLLLEACSQHGIEIDDFVDCYIDKLSKEITYEELSHTQNTYEINKLVEKTSLECIQSLN